MHLLDRYIAKNVIVATGLVLAVLVGLDIFMLFFAEMGDVGKSHYTISKALLYVLMHLPFDLYQLFPMAGFLGCLIGLGRMANQSELVVMRASGASIGGILWAVIKAALLMLLLVTVFGEVVSPKLQAYSERMKAVALGKAKNYTSLGGVWLREQNRFIYIGDIVAADKALNVSVFTLKNHQLLGSDYAPRAHRLADGRWQLQAVQQTTWHSGKITAQHIPQMTLNIKLDPLVLSLGSKSIDQLSVAGLYQSIKYRKQSGLSVEQYQFAFWQRVFQPLATIIMICLGIPFIFGSLRNASMGLRILTGIIIGFVFYTINQFLGPLAVVYQLSPIVAALIPAVIFVISYVILFRRIT